MKLAFAPELHEFRAEAADWLNEQLSGSFRSVRGQTNQVDAVEERRAWEQALGQARWSVIGWPEQWGGRDASIALLHGDGGVLSSHVSMFLERMR